jgi:hypothetical protein
MKKLAFMLALGIAAVPATLPAAAFVQAGGRALRGPQEAADDAGDEGPVGGL